MFRAQNRYKVCSGYEAVNYIEKCLKHGCSTALSSDQRRVLREQFGDSGIRGNLGMDVQFYVWQDEGVEGCNAWWRLTWPFFFIVLLLFHLTVYPIHWVCTGKYSLGKDSWLLSILYKWEDKIYKWRRE